MALIYERCNLWDDENGGVRSIEAAVSCECNSPTLSQPAMSRLPKRSMLAISIPFISEEHISSEWQAHQGHLELIILPGVSTHGLVAHEASGSIFAVINEQEVWF